MSESKNVFYIVDNKLFSALEVEISVVGLDCLTYGLN